MKTIMNKLFILITVITLITITTGCSPSTLKQPQENSNSETFIISGGISLNADALPKEFINKNIAGSRTAISSFSTTDPDFSYSVIAVQDFRTQTASISNSEGNFTYTLSLNYRGTWTIKAYLYYGSEIIAQSENKITISDSLQNGASIPSQLLLNYNPTMDSNKTGAVKLGIKSDYSDPVEITWHWTKGSTTLPADDTKTIWSSGETVNFIFDSVVCGAYNVEITFKDSAGNVLYSCDEAINVFADWTTDTWCGKAPYFNDRNEFVFDSTVQQSYGQIIPSLENLPDSPLFVLWSDIPEETDSSGQPTAQNAIGLQIFDSVKEGMAITNPIHCGYNYCFDDTTLYAPPYRYIQSYAGYTRDDSFDLYNMDVEPLRQYPSDYLSFGNCCILDGYVYFIFYFGYRPYIGRYNTQDCTITFSKVQVVDTYTYCTAIAVTHEENNPNSGVLYIAATENEWHTTLYRKPFEVGFDDNDNVTYINFRTMPWEEGNYYYTDLNINDLDDSFSIRWPYGIMHLTITDMTILNEKLYVLVAVEGLTNPSGDQTIYKKNALEEYEPYMHGFISTGGVLKFDVSSTAAAANDFAPESWGNNVNPNSNNLMLGVYTLSNDTTYYYNEQAPGSSQPEYDSFTLSSGEHISVQPPLAEANEYFYGPRKILATKSNQLIIADDGGYMEATGFTGDKSKSFQVTTQIPKNRIITINLDSPTTFNIVDVGTTFTSAYTDGKYYYSTSTAPQS